MRVAVAAGAIALLAACAGNNLDDTTGVAGGGVGGNAAGGSSRRGGGNTIGGNGTGAPAGSAGSAGSSSAPSTGTAGLSGGTSTGTSSANRTGSSTGSTSGGGGASCNVADAGQSEVGSCSADADCDCPLVCNDDIVFQMSVCEAPCLASSDCLDPRTVCRGGACVFNLCGPSGGGPNGGPNGAASGACDAAGTNDGSCWADYSPANSVTGQGAAVSWFCYQGGTAPAGSGCTVARGAADVMCEAGSICASPDGGAASSCVPLCDPTSLTPTCPSGEGCGAIDLSDNLAPEWGLCHGEADGCLEGYTDNELSPCGPNLGCGCVTGKPLTCVSDPLLGPSEYGTETYCERICTGTSDCPIVFTSCNAKNLCDLNYCGDGGLGYSAPCNASDAGDGTCVPYGNSGGTATRYGLCYQGGTATSACDSSAERGASTELCLPGAYCFNVTGQTQQQCFTLCDPIGSDHCPGIATCEALDSASNPVSPDLGICQ